MHNLVIVAHRGASFLSPENTIEAFRLATRMGAHMVELDVQLSKDGHVVVIHDETLNRTTSGWGLVKSHTLAQLKKLDAGGWFSPEFKGARIPTLDEVYLSLPRHTGVNIELKTNIFRYPGIEEKVLEIMHKHRAQYRTIVSSFNWESLRELHRLDPKLKLGLLFNEPTAELWTTARMLNAVSIHPPLIFTDTNLIWQAHSWGYRVFPWVVNDPAIVLKLRAFGIDGVITDCPQNITHYQE